MSPNNLIKLPFEHSDEQFEVWISFDRENWKYTAAIRKNARELGFDCGDGHFVVRAYSVTFEVEQDSKVLLKRSAVSHAIDAAKLDVERYPYQLVESDKIG